MIENYPHNHLFRNDAGRRIELDVYLPKERLAFEYQGEQHYYDIYALGNFGYKRKKIKKKEKYVKKMELN